MGDSELDALKKSSDGLANYSHGAISDEEGLDEDTPLQPTVVTRARAFSNLSSAYYSSYLHTLSQSVQHIRNTSWSISLIDKPSDDRRNSSLLAVWSLTILLQGTGMLGLPYAMNQCGLWGALTVVILVALITYYTAFTLGKCLYQVSPRTGQKKRVYGSYSEIGQGAFPAWGGTLVNIMVVVDMFGVATCYIVCCGNVLAEITQVKGLGSNEWSAISACVALPLVFIERFSLLAWTSVLSVLGSLASTFFILLYSLISHGQWEESYLHVPVEAEAFPVGFGIIVFTFVTHTIVVEVEGSMRHPESYNKVLIASFGLSALVKVFLGVTAMLTFGPAIQEVVIVNMVNVKGFGIASTICVCVNVFFAYPLTIFVCKAVWDNVLIEKFPHMIKGTQYHWVWLGITRPILVCLTLFVGAVIPHFGLLTGLLGNISGMCLTFIFPAVFYLKLKWHKMGYFEIGLNVFIAVIGSLLGILGFVFSAMALVKKIM